MKELWDFRPHQKTWNDDCKMGAKAKMLCRDFEGVGVNKIIFYSFKVGFFIVTLIHLTCPSLIMGNNFAKCPKDAK